MMLNSGELVSVKTLPAVDGKHPRGIILRRMRMNDNSVIYTVVVKGQQSVRCRENDIEVIQTTFKLGEKIKLNPDLKIYSRQELIDLQRVCHYQPSGGRSGTIHKIFERDDGYHYVVKFRVNGYYHNVTLPERLIVQTQVKNEVYFIEE